MPVIGVTGGIASGKSTVSRLLADGLNRSPAVVAEVFSADACAHELLATNTDVQAEVRKNLGLNPEETGPIDREKLRQIVFDHPDARLRLEAILHPRIRKIWTERAERFRTRGQYLVAEIPLLYETKAETLFDSVIVVEANAQIQLERLSSKRGWSLETARRVIAAQMSAEEKSRRADILILNGYSEKLLASQVELAVAALLTRYA